MTTSLSDGGGGGSIGAGRRDMEGGERGVKRKRKERREEREAGASCPLG
jgi:hypothetical protein